MPNYNVWIKHRAKGIMLENDEEEEVSILILRMITVPALKMMLVRCWAKWRKSMKQKGIEGSEAYVGGLQNIVVPMLQTRAKKVGYHIGITAMQDIKWFVRQGIRGVAEIYKKNYSFAEIYKKNYSLRVTHCLKQQTRQERPFVL